MKFDRSYKRLFSSQKLVRHMAEAYLYGDWTADVRWDTLTDSATCTVSPGGIQRENDMVWKVNRRDGSEVLIFLMIEFQSTVEKDMILRMNIYSAMLLWSQCKRIRGRLELPKVAPVVVYTGTAPWTAATALAEVTPKWPRSLEPMGVCDQTMQYVLVSARDAPEIECRERNLADGLFRMERSDGKEEISAASVWMHEALQRANDEALEDNVVRWFNDVFCETRLTGMEAKVSSLSEVPEMLDQNFESWADRFAAEGRAEGRAQGLAEGAAQGRKQLLLRLVRARFGQESAAAVEPALRSIRSIPTLDEIGDWVIDCGSADTLIARIDRVSR